MKGAWQQVCMALIVTSLILGPDAIYGAAKAQQAADVKVCTGTLKGSVTDSAGKGLSGVRVRLMRDDKVIAETRTDKDGKYVLKNVPKGKLKLLVGDEKPLTLVASSDVTAKTLKVVVSARKGYSAAALSSTTWMWIGIGTGALAIAVATPIIVNNTGGSTGKGAISP